MLGWFLVGVIALNLAFFGAGLFLGVRALRRENRRVAYGLVTGLFVFFLAVYAYYSYTACAAASADACAVYHQVSNALLALSTFNYAVVASFLAFFDYWVVRPE